MSKKRDDQPFEPGFNFKEGKLRIFTEDCVMVIRGWPEPTAVFKRAGDRTWTAFEPNFPLVRPYRRSARRKQDDQQLELSLEPVPTRMGLAEQRKRAFDAFRFSLPKEVAAGLERFHAAQWRLLRLVHKHPGGLDLLKSNPVLGFCLADLRAVRSNLRERRDLPPVERLVCMKQRELAGVLGFPSAEGSVKLMRKTVPESLNGRLFGALREALHDDDSRKMLSHVAQINVSVLDVAVDFDLRKAVTPNFVNEVAKSGKDKYYPHAARMLTDVINMHRDLRPDASRKRFNSMASLKSFYDEVSVEFCRAHPGQILRARFPRPPIRGNQFIVPVRTPEELMREGEEQKNCVACYAKWVEAREKYIYRVLHPQRATLSLVRRGGGWCREELKLARNISVNAGTVSFVDEWLSRHSLSV